jgi:hypothetical protein
VTRRITIDDLRTWRLPPWICARFPSGATPRQVLDEERLSLADRGWILSRALAEWDRAGLADWARESTDLDTDRIYAPARYASASADLAAAVPAADLAAAVPAADLAAAYAAASAAHAAERSAYSSTRDRTYRKRLEACVARLEAIQ